MKNIVTHLIIGLALMTVFCGCRHSSDSGQGPMHELVIVNATTENTKAIGTGGNMTAFEIGDKLGVFVVNTVTSTMQDENVKATYIKGDDATLDKWELERPILLVGTDVLVTGYFPYIAGVPLNAIPLTSGTHDVNKNDVIVLQQTANGVDNYELRLENMKHAMTRVKIKLKLDPAFTPGRYPGAGKVASFTIADNTASELIYTDGLLDASNVVGTNPTVKPSTAGAVKTAKEYTLTETSTQVFDVLLLPVADITGDVVKFVLEIDGQTMELPVPSASAGAQSWVSGKAYTYELTVRELGISFVKVAATPWNDAGKADQVLTPVAVGQLVDGGVVFWIDPDNAKHYKVISIFEPATATLADAQKYAAAYGPDWRLITTEEGLWITANNLGEVQDAFAKYAGMLLQREFYWVSGSATNAYNIIRVEEADQAVDSKCNVRLVKEVTVL